MENKNEQKVISDRASKLSNKNVTRENIERLIGKKSNRNTEPKENIEKQKTGKSEKK